MEPECSQDRQRNLPYILQINERGDHLSSDFPTLPLNSTPEGVQDRKRLLLYCSNAMISLGPT